MKYLHYVLPLVLPAGLFVPAFAAERLTPFAADVLVSLAPVPSELRRISLQTVRFMLGVPRKTSSPDRSLSPQGVENLFGIPGAKLSPNLWVYWNFKADDIPGCESGDTLVVEFTDNRVSFVRFGQGEEVRAFIAQLQVETLKTKIVAK